MTSDQVAPPTGERLALLKRLGFADLQHDSHVPFMSHLLGTRRLLVQWGEPAALCDAGLFHSAYGTEYFPVAEPASRDDIRAVIGEDAEQIAHWWCTIRRDTIELTDPPTVVDRRTDERIELSDEAVRAIATLWAADTVEQVARMDPHERAFARQLRAVLDRASPAGRSAAEAVLPLLDET